MSQVANSLTIQWSEVGNFTYANVITGTTGAVQAWSANLDAIAALTPANTQLIVGNGTTWQSATTFAAVSPTAIVMALIFGG